MDEHTACSDEGNAILTGSPQNKDRRFIGSGFEQCGQKMRGNELSIVIGESRFGLRHSSQDPVADKAGFPLDLDGSQETSKIRGGQLSNELIGSSRNLSQRRRTVQSHKEEWVLIHGPGNGG